MSQNYKTEWSHNTIHSEMKDEVTGEERKVKRRKEDERERIIYATE